jgi:hypothetical protein
MNPLAGKILDNFPEILVVVVCCILVGYYFFYTANSKKLSDEEKTSPKNQMTNGKITHVDFQKKLIHKVSSSGGVWYSGDSWVPEFHFVYSVNNIELHGVSSPPNEYDNRDNTSFELIAKFGNDKTPSLAFIKKWKDSFLNSETTVFYEANNPQISFVKIGYVDKIAQQQTVKVVALLAAIVGIFIGFKIFKSFR